MTHECDMWHMTCDIWHMTHGVAWTFSQNFSCLALMAWDLWCCEYLEEKADWLTEWINELMNDEAVYRAAPATPGLLNMTFLVTWGYEFQYQHVLILVVILSAHLKQKSVANYFCNIVRSIKSLVTQMLVYNFLIFLSCSFYGQKEVLSEKNENKNSWN